MRTGSFRTAPTRRERWAITLVTAGFIAVSAMLHVLLGSAFPRNQWRVARTPSEQLVIFNTYSTPTPTPRPTPRSSPTPHPTLAQPHPLPLRSLTTHVVAMRKPSMLSQPASEASPAAPTESGPTPAEPQPAPAEPATPGDYRYVIVSARFLNEVHPDYPRDALENGEEGTVIVLLTVGPDGVSDVRIWVSSGYPSLDRAGLQAAKESTYSAPEVNGEPATETYRVIYTFDINS